MPYRPSENFIHNSNKQAQQKNGGRQETALESYARKAGRPLYCSRAKLIHKSQTESEVITK